MPVGRGLGVPDALGQLEPLVVALGGVGEAVLGGEHGGHAPEALVVVAEGGGEVARLVVAVVARLVDHALRDDGVVRVVAREVPVVDVGAHHGAPLPPVVVALAVVGRAGEDAGGLARLVAVVEEHQVVGQVARRFPDFVCRGSRGREEKWSVSFVFSPSSA